MPRRPRSVFVSKPGRNACRRGISCSVVREDREIIDGIWILGIEDKEPAIPKIELGCGQDRLVTDPPILPWRADLVAPTLWRRDIKHQAAPTFDSSAPPGGLSMLATAAPLTAAVPYHSGCHSAGYARFAPIPTVRGVACKIERAFAALFATLPWRTFRWWQLGQK